MGEDLWRIIDMSALRAIGKDAQKLMVSSRVNKVEDAFSVKQFLNEWTATEFQVGTKFLMERLWSHTREEAHSHDTQ